MKHLIEEGDSRGGPNPATRIASGHTIFQLFPALPEFDPAVEILYCFCLSNSNHNYFGILF
jgi:hypothetical protein